MLCPAQAADIRLHDSSSIEAVESMQTSVPGICAIAMSPEARRRPS